jgi:2-dehydropantoate 2-reductase
LKKELKRIAVLGAGAVGCFFGGMLARAGKEVLLIARDNHVQAIKKNGLLMEFQDSQEYVSIEASSNIKDIADADLILCCVKSPDTERVMREVKDLIKPDALILSLQNGVDNAERISQVVPNHAISAVVYVATGMGGDGHVKHFGRGELIIGQLGGHENISVELEEICSLFLSAQIPCMVSSNIQRELWLKFLVNCSYNGISAIGQITYGEMVQQESIRQLIKDLTDEFLLVANQEKIDISLAEAQMANEQIAKTMAGQRSSTAQDLMRHKPTEIDYLNGLIVRKAKQHGLNAPNHQAIYALVKMIEQKIMRHRFK